MIFFQLIVIALLAVVFVKDVISLYRRRSGAMRWVPVAIWLAAALGIAFPNSVTWLAHIVGINRGADLVLYVSCLTLVYWAFWLYSRILAIELKINTFVREKAIKEASRGGEPSPAGVQSHGA